MSEVSEIIWVSPNSETDLQLHQHLPVTEHHNGAGTAAAALDLWGPEASEHAGDPESMNRIR